MVPQRQHVQQGQSFLQLGACVLRHTVQAVVLRQQTVLLTLDDGFRQLLAELGRIDVLLGNGLPAGLLGTGAVVGAEEAAEEDGGGEGEWKNDAGVFHGGASFASKS